MGGRKRSHKNCFIDLYKVYNILKNFKVTLFKIKTFGPKTQLLGKNYKVVDLNFEPNLTENLKSKLGKSKKKKKIEFSTRISSKLTFFIFSKNPIRVKI